MSFNHLDLTNILNLVQEQSNANQKVVQDSLKTPSPPSSIVNELPSGPPLVKPKRCQGIGCKAKIGLTSFICKCEGWYCGMHRHAENHSCSFDYKTKGQVSLEKALIKVAGEKLEKV